MKYIITILGAIIIASFIMSSCGQNSTKQKELELKEKELALKEKQLALDSVRNSNSVRTSLVSKAKQDSVSKQTQVSSQSKAMSEKKLIDKEYGTYSFNIPCGNHGWGLTIKFIQNTNKVSCSEGGIVAQGEVGESASNGTFTVDKIDDNYKYVTCKFKSKETYKLKYSIKKGKWILLNMCDNAPEVEAEKN